MQSKNKYNLADYYEVIENQAELIYRPIIFNQIWKIMKPSQRVNGQPASKNVVSPKPKIPISPKNTIKNKVGSTGDLFQVKS